MCCGFVLQQVVPATSCATCCTTNPSNVVRADVRQRMTTLTTVAQLDVAGYYRSQGVNTPSRRSRLLQELRNKHTKVRGDVHGTQ